MNLVGISHVKDVIVGDTRRKGISGGERKRLCIAMELLNRPALLFLDEPTSGLDSSTALSVCTALKRLSHMGVCTVICTIHQPQQRIFELFDNLILMRKGNVIYQGGTMKAISFLGSLGHNCPEGSNPADFLIEMITSQDESEKVATDELTAAVKRKVVDLKLGADKPVFAARNLNGWLVQVQILLVRNVQQQMRRKDILGINLMVSISIALFVALGSWRHLGTDQASLVGRSPSLFFACVTQGIIASLISTHSFPLERALSLRERAAGTYYVSAYFIAKTISDTLFQLISPIVFSCIVYPVIGYQNKVDKFFIYMMFMILDTMAATSLATMLSCLCVSIELTTVVMSFFFEVCRLYGGFFMSPAQVATTPNWAFADALSYIKYVYVGVALNEYSGLELTCTEAEVIAKTCIAYGNSIIISKGYDKYSVALNAGVLVIYIVLARFVAYLALRFIKN